VKKSFQGDKRIFNHLGEVDFNFLPHNIQCNIKVIITLRTEYLSINLHSNITLSLGKVIQGSLRFFINPLILFFLTIFFLDANFFVE
jgi:hypothetical protein